MDDKKQRNYWYLQMSTTGNVKLDLAFLDRKEIAIAYEDKHKPTQKIEDFQKMKRGDIVLVKRNGSTIALVEITQNYLEEYESNETIRYYKHDIEILEKEMNRADLPECRGILKRVTKGSIYKYIDKWYKEIIDRMDLESGNIKTVDIEIENVKSIRKLIKKFRIRLNGELYIIVGNNGIGKSTLLISLGHLTKQTFLQGEFKGDAFNKSKITYTFNNTEKFEWKKFNQKSKKMAWTSQNGTMPRIDGIFESGIVSGSRFEHLEFKKDVLEQVENNKIKGNFKQDKESIEFIRENLSYIINGEDRDNRYESLFIDEVYIERSGKREIIYFYKDFNKKIISEYSFSTGEYFVLALLKLINNKRKSKKSLIIIDELDISLHPLAQNRLMERINQFRKEFNITFIVATHSLQIIQNSNAENLYLFENINGHVTISNPIYPAYITKSLYKHSYYDKIILVEDELAKRFIERFIDKLDNEFKYRLYYTIIPIGGWKQVLDIFRNKDKYYPNTDVIAIFDKDIQHYLKSYQNEDILFIPVEENIEKYTVKNLLQNPIFHRYIEVECLEDTYKFNDLDIKEYRDIDNSQYIKNIFYDRNKGNGLINEIQNYSKDRFKDKKYLIEEKIVDFIIKELKEKEYYVEFGEKLKSFLDIIQTSPPTS
jgi:ABC-type lipoprotein export system ATPase subunit